MKRVLRIATILLLLALAGLGGGYLYLGGSLPQIDGERHLAGLSGEVEIVRDRNGIPHITAASARDALFGLGFVHAQDRLWQMEMNRRIGHGRLSEVFGETTLGTDKFLRTLGLHRHAERSFALLKPETQALLTAYAEGVNAYLASHDGPLPPEFLILGITPEPWRPVNSLAWLKMMAWDLGGNWNKELLRLKLSKSLSMAQIAEFLPPYPGDAPVALPDLASLYGEAEIDVAALEAAAPEPLPDGAGSNNWVVSGARSTSGKPLLANDPHLGLAAPALWYFAHIKAPGLEAIGATLPGVPAVVLGRNQRIAWGFTNTGPDVQDLYLEKLVPGQPGHYLTPNGPRPFETVQEVIRVKDADPVTLDVRISRHGPVISDALDSAAEALSQGYVLSFAWTALSDDDHTVEAGLNMMRAGDWASFREAVRDYRAPQQNMVYADVDGNIGYIAPARVPIRKPENDLKGLMPAPGWLAAYDWDGFIPFDDLPQSFNPPSGAIVTANHKIVGPDYPYQISLEWTLPYRANRITEMLGSRPRHDLASFRQAHGDVKSLMVADLLPLMLAAEAKSERSARALDLLKSWNGEMVREQAAPLIFSAWMRELTRQIYADELGPQFEGAWQQRPLFISNVLADRDGQGRWCDDVKTAEAENCPMILARSLDSALEDLAARYGGDMEDWRWGPAHFALSDHRPFSKIPVLRDIFEITVPSMGGTYTVNVGRHDIRKQDAPFANEHAASIRAIYDLADLDRSLFIHSTGQSGNPLSPLYANFAAPWADTDYVPMTTKREEYSQSALGRLLLKPGD